MQFGAEGFQIDPQGQALVREGSLQPGAETAAIGIENPATLVNVGELALTLGQLGLGTHHHQFHLANRFADNVVRENLAGREQCRRCVQLTALDFCDQLTAPTRGHLSAQLGVLDSQMFERIEQHHIANGLRNAQA
ncbi:hypothetical protein D3C75_1069250 [compost metagenome]